MNTVLPNLLVVGSAKCGTSSLHNYLAQHPEIFMSAAKEPRFISSQGTKFPLMGPKDHKVEAWYIKNYDHYVSLFEHAANYKVIGESSADTLYFHEHTIDTIKKYIGNPKILIVLRNPVKRAFSAYQHLVRDGREMLTFEDALHAEPDRIRNNWELIYHYRHVSRYYGPVKDFLSNFTHVKVILSEQLEKEADKTLQGVFEFLGVDSVKKIDDTNTKYNISGKPRSRWLHSVLTEGHPMLRTISPIARAIFSGDQRKKMSLKLQQLNLNRLKINPDTEQMLKNEFQEEINNLEQLLKIDLSKWR